MWLTGHCDEELVVVLQHFCLLVPPSQRRQLQILLRYLGKMSTNPRLVLHSHFTNRQQVCPSGTYFVPKKLSLYKQTVKIFGVICAFRTEVARDTRKDWLLANARETGIDAWFLLVLKCSLQGSHTSWKVVDFFWKIPGPGKSWKITLVSESPGKISLKVVHFSSGSNGKQKAEIFAMYLLHSEYCIFYCVLLCFIVILIEHYVFKSSMLVLPFYNKRMYVWCMYVYVNVVYFIFKHSGPGKFLMRPFKVVKKSWIVCQ